MPSYKDVVPRLDKQSTGASTSTQRPQGDSFMQKHGLNRGPDSKNGLAPSFDNLPAIRSNLTAPQHRTINRFPEKHADVRESNDANAHRSPRFEKLPKVDERPQFGERNLDLHSNHNGEAIRLKTRNQESHARFIKNPELHAKLSNVALAEHLRTGRLDHLTNANLGKKLDLHRQFDLHHHGDLARQLDLRQKLEQHGGWAHRHHGPVAPFYTKHCFSHCYCGPSWFPNYCWYPIWSGWVNWCWNFPCIPTYDPRPICCQPWSYNPCAPWVVWEYPVWEPMPVVACGTWVDVPVVEVASGLDLQLLAVRFVDPGHPEQKLGPRYRVWVRNNSAIAIDQPFDVIAYASNDRLPAAGLPEAGVTVTQIEAGQIQAIDLRLPYEASLMDRDESGSPQPFRFLHVIVDSGRQVAEVTEANNGAVLDRRDVLPVDPVIFGTDSEETRSGAEINIAGEGFGPEPGRVLINVRGVELQGEVIGWYDLGVRVKLPDLAGAVNDEAEIVVVRGDDAASNPMSLALRSTRLINFDPASP
jgi:hypothetical protein